MYINGLGSATPSQRYTKAACLEAFESSHWYRQLKPRSLFIARTVLQRNNGIEARHLALETLDEVFKIDPNTLAERYLQHAPALAASAARNALRDSGLRGVDIGAVVISTCTGYLCPGLSGYVIERLQLGADTQAFDLVGQGCAAALPNMQLANALLASGLHRHVLSVCVEVSTAAMYLDDDPGVLISACLFGDGAGAAILSAAPEPGRRTMEWIDSASFINPAERTALMFEERDGMLRNILTRAVPALAARHARDVLDLVLKRNGVERAEIAAWIMHAGGRDVLLALEQSFDLEPIHFQYSAATLLEYGNLSSAFVYFVLQAALADDAADGWWWLSAFGAGFSCHGALLTVRS